jgi:hypothetical protein
MRRGLKVSFYHLNEYFRPPQQKRMQTNKKVSCANIKNRKHPSVRCTYPAIKGEFCSRHWKNPRKFSPENAVIATRSVYSAAKKIHKWWKLVYGLKLSKERTPAFFIRELCTNETEISSFEPLHVIPRDYFFVIVESNKFWGYDIRSLLVQYETLGLLENVYTRQECSKNALEAFRSRLNRLKLWKKSLVLENTNVLTAKQSWSLRVLDVCLRLDMLGYRIATQWFSDLDIYQQKELYTTLYNLWNEKLALSEELKARIVPGHSNLQNKLFKWSVEKVISKQDLDSVRRTNINVIERLISSASEQSDKTLGAMYTVIGLTYASPKIREAYPWLA